MAYQDVLKRTAGRHEDDGDQPTSLNVILLQFTLLQHFDCKSESDEFSFKSVYAHNPHAEGKTFCIRIIDLVGSDQ